MAGATGMRPRTQQVSGIWLLLPYALLIFSSTLTWASQDLTTDEIPWALAGSVGVAVWHYWWAGRHQDWFEVRTGPMLGYFLGFVSLTAFLFHLSFNFFALYLVCFAMAFVALPGRWAYAGVALAAAVALLGPGLLTWSTQNVIVMLAAGTIAAAAGWSIRALESETIQRRAALAELARTHAELEHTSRQNLALRDRLVDEARTSGVATERARLAGEIHDTLAAGLAAVISQLEAIDGELAADHPQRRRVRAALDVAGDNLHEARRAVRALRPGPLADQALPRALAEVVADFERTHEISTRWHLTGSPFAVSAPIEDALLRAAKEGLTNVDRHARATTVHVTLSYLCDAIALDIVDDGAGVRPVTRQGQGGQGLDIMAERLASLGGRMDLSAVPGHGTTLTVTVPVPAPEVAT